MALTYKEFADFVQKSELMAVVSDEKKADMLERYKDFSEEQLEEAVKIISEHEASWKQVTIDNQKKLQEAGANLNQALQAAQGRVIEDIHQKEAVSRKSEEAVLISLEEELDKLSN